MTTARLVGFLFHAPFMQKANRAAIATQCLLCNESASRRGKIKMYSRHEMLDLVKVGGKARGIIRNLVTGEIERHVTHAVVIASEVMEIYFIYQPMLWAQCNCAWKIHKKGAYFANPCFTQIHPLVFPFRATTSQNLP